MDLSPLDPMQDPDHWREVVDRTLMRMDVLLARRQRDPLTLIASWSRVLKLAAIIVILLLIPVEFMLEKRESTTEQIELLARFSVASVQADTPPSGAELSRVLIFGGQP